MQTELENSRRATLVAEGEVALLSDAMRLLMQHGAVAQFLRLHAETSRDFEGVLRRPSAQAALTSLRAQEAVYLQGFEAEVARLVASQLEAAGGAAARHHTPSNQGAHDLRQTAQAAAEAGAALLARPFDVPGVRKAAATKPTGIHGRAASTVSASAKAAQAVDGAAGAAGAAAVTGSVVSVVEQDENGNYRVVQRDVHGCAVTGAAAVSGVGGGLGGGHGASNGGGGCSPAGSGGLSAPLGALLTQLDLDMYRGALEEEEILDIDCLKSMGSEMLESNMKELGLDDAAVARLGHALFPRN